MKRYIALIITTNMYAIMPPPQLPKNLLPLPLVRQATDYTCGPTTLQAIYGWYGEQLREDQIRNNITITRLDGTDYLAMITHAQTKGYRPLLMTHTSLAVLEQFITLGYPVICLIQAWGKKKYYDTIYSSGHYVIAVGFDKKYIYFMDPAILGNYGYLPKEQFLAAWHGDTNAGKVEHLALVIVSRTSSARYKPGRPEKIE